MLAPSATRSRVYIQNLSNVAGENAIVSNVASDDARGPFVLGPGDSLYFTKEQDGDLPAAEWRVVSDSAAVPIVVASEG
jgi:hypothetical protein